MSRSLNCDHVFSVLKSTNVPQRLNGSTICAKVMVEACLNAADPGPANSIQSRPRAHESSIWYRDKSWTSPGDKTDCDLHQTKARQMGSDEKDELYIIYVSNGSKHNDKIHPEPIVAGIKQLFSLTSSW